MTTYFKTVWKFIFLKKKPTWIFWFQFTIQLDCNIHEFLLRPAIAIKIYDSDDVWREDREYFRSNEHSKKVAKAHSKQLRAGQSAAGKLYERCPSDLIFILFAGLKSVDLDWMAIVAICKVDCIGHLGSHGFFTSTFTDIERSDCRRNCSRGLQTKSNDRAFTNNICTAVNATIFIAECLRSISKLSVP